MLSDVHHFLSSAKVKVYAPEGEARKNLGLMAVFWGPWILLSLETGFTWLLGLSRVVDVKESTYVDSMVQET